MRRTLSLVRVGCALILACVGAPAPAQSDADFLGARAAYDRGDRVRLDALAGKLGSHLLVPYVEYWQLKLRLDTASDDEVKRYLARWPETPLADRLRIEWLKALARRGQWTAFAAEYPPPTGEDLELTCYGLQYRRMSDADGALGAAKPLWFSGQTAPDSCEPLLSALIARGDLSIDDRRTRFRLASEAGNLRLAHSIAADMPPAERIATRDFARVEPNPTQALLKGDFQLKQPAGRDLALFTLERAARSDAASARPGWEKLRGALPARDRTYGNARIAFYAARQLNPQALEWFREADESVLTEAMRGWRVRAALRAGAWPDVLKAIDAMPASESQESSWRYWKARALQAGGRGDEANGIYTSLASEVGFYGLLSAEALGKRVEPASLPFDANPDALASFGERAAVRRAVKLAQLEMRSESQREWLYVVRGLPDEGLLLAAEYARRQGLHDRSINTADRTVSRHDFALRYPTPFREQFTAAAGEQAVDEALLFAIARQESRFASDIVSSAGAVGLMQVMPPTARWVAKQLNRSDYLPSQISDVGINTQFGAFYFKYWLDRLERMPALAAAAYNAGPGRAQAWRVGAPLEGAVWVETIPFNETRDYVKKVLANAMIYARLLNQSYVPLAARLGTVPARGSGAGAALNVN